MSTEDRLVKQLDGIVSSIIKALEGLEKELSEYIEVTNKRLQNIEDKMQKYESLADVSGQGLVKAIESSSTPDKVRGLAHLTTQSTTPAPKPTPVSAVEAPTVKPPITQPEPISPTPPTPSLQSAVESPKLDVPSGLPPVPKPPSVTTVMDAPPQAPTVSSPQAASTTPSPPTVASKTEALIKKKEDEDKDELRSALDIIDSL